MLAVQSTWPSRPVERGSVLPASGISFFCSPPESGQVGGIMSFMMIMMKR